MRFVLSFLIPLNWNALWINERRKYRVGFTFYGSTEVAFLDLRIDDLAVKRLADVFEFSLAAHLAIIKYVLYYAAIGADQITFVDFPLSGDLWQLLWFDWICAKLVGKLGVKTTSLVRGAVFPELKGFNIFSMSFICLKFMDVLLESAQLDSILSDRDGKKGRD